MEFDKEVKKLEEIKNTFKDLTHEYEIKIQNAIKEHINFVLATTTYPLTEKNLPLIFKDKIHELSDIHSLQINIFSLEGKLLKSSKASFSIDSVKASRTA